MKFTALALSLAVMLVAAPAKAQHAGEPVRVILVGDSTMARGSGWGDQFCAAADAAVTCINLAKGGRSSGSYRAEGSWRQVMAELARPGPWRETYVFVQFGHNDQAGGAANIGGQFASNMAAYVSDVRSAGGTPVLITPVTRRSFRNGLLVDGLSQWSAAVRKVARETGTPLLDLASDSVLAVQQMGPVRAMDLAQAPPPEEVRKAAESGTTIEAPKEGRVYFDYTHLGEAGGRFFAAMAIDELRLALPGLAARFGGKPRAGEE